MQGHMTDLGVRKIDAQSLRQQPMRYFDFFIAAFVAILLLSNLIGAAKLSTLFGFTFGAGILFFPLGYVLGDVLTEVYGYARARRCVWAGFGAMLFMALMSWVVVALPPDAGWNGQLAYERVFGQVPRIVVASIIAFWCGEFANSFVLAKMKLWTRGRHLWSRTIGSTLVGQGVDSLIFYPLAFLGLPDWPADKVVTILATQWVLKVSWEAILTPLTYLTVNFLKSREGLDIYDSDTDFTPFRTKV